MANNYRNPWIIDTAGALPFRQQCLRGVMWVGYTAANHQAVLQDERGVSIFEATAPDTSGDPIALAWTSDQWFRGLNVTTLDSGRLIIDVK